MIAVFGGKWRPLIMLHLIGSSRQFLELQRIIPGISQKVLTRRLRELVAEDIVFRKSSGQAPAPVSYGLTPYGETVIPILDAMCKWTTAIDAILERGSMSRPESKYWQIFAQATSATK